METFFCGLPVVDAFMTSDWMGKFIVILLIIFSSYSFVKIVVRYSIYKATDAEHQRLMSIYRQYKHPAGIIYEGLVKGICNVEIYRTVMLELVPKLEQHGISSEQLRRWKGDTPLPSLSIQELSKIKVIAESELAKQLRYLENDLSTIGTISVIAPSLGLFGTVWGVLLSFMSMADGSGAAIITNVAPGIGGALLTTVAGLVVSIPTTLVYNILCTKLRIYTGQAESFVDRLIADIYLYHSPKENLVQIAQLSAIPQQPQYTAAENYEVGGKYNA